ncbi:MAG: hypothetical protein LBM25_00800 [Bacteroidales bacterium]|jgi:hypothetical protein|nr:hypothetical protein [Bacteroidales bacterium]
MNINKYIFIIFTLCILFLSCTNTSYSIKESEQNYKQERVEIRPKINIHEQSLLVGTNNDCLKRALDTILNNQPFKSEIIILNYIGNKWVVDIEQESKFHIKPFMYFEFKYDILLYKNNLFYINKIDTNIFNTFFYKLDKLKILHSVISDYYDESSVYYSVYYKNEKMLIHARCDFEFEIINDKLMNFKSNCDSISFATKEELIKLYGE